MSRTRHTYARRMKGGVARSAHRCWFTPTPIRRSPSASLTRSLRLSRGTCIRRDTSCNAQDGRDDGCVQLSGARSLPTTRPGSTLDAQRVLHQIALADTPVYAVVQRPSCSLSRHFVVQLFTRRALTCGNVHFVVVACRPLRAVRAPVPGIASAAFAAHWRLPLPRRRLRGDQRNLSLSACRAFTALDVLTDSVEGTARPPDSPRQRSGKSRRGRVCGRVYPPRLAPPSLGESPTQAV